MKYLEAGAGRYMPVAPSFGYPLRQSRQSTRFNQEGVLLLVDIPKWTQNKVLHLFNENQ
jgi:hypothetical protein